MQLKHRSDSLTCSWPWILFALLCGISVSSTECTGRRSHRRGPRLLYEKLLLSVHWIPAAIWKQQDTDKICSLWYDKCCARVQCHETRPSTVFTLIKSPGCYKITPHTSTHTQYSYYAWNIRLSGSLILCVVASFTSFFPFLSYVLHVVCHVTLM